MKIITEGHSYQLANHQDRGEGQALHFIHKEPVKEGSKQLRTVRVGTTNEEVLDVLIDRVEFLNQRMPCRENELALGHLQTAKDCLLARTQRRTEAGVEGTNEPRSDESAANELLPPPPAIVKLPATATGVPVGAHTATEVDQTHNENIGTGDPHDPVAHETATGEPGAKTEQP